jgi:hypothetical protein
MKRVATLATALAAVLTLTTVHAQTTPKIPPGITTPDKVQTSIGTLEFKDGAPSAETVRKVYDSLDFVRGVDAFMNSFSGASAYAIREGFHSIGADDNTIVVFSDLWTRTPFSSPPTPIPSIRLRCST